MAGEPPPSVLYRRQPRPAASARDVLNVMGFEPLAREALPPAHFAYLATGVDGDLTVARNQEAFTHYEIRARRFADLRRIDTSQRVLGVSGPSPLYLSAVSSMRAFHPDGELAVARAAKSRTTQFGRPHAWGVAAFGQPGVEAMIDILNRELTEIMRQAGTPRLADITSAHVLRSPP